MNCLTAKDVKFNLLQCQAFNRDHCGKRSFGCFQFTEKMLNVELGEGNLIFCHMGSQENYLGWSVCKIVIIIILSLGFGTSKNKNINHWGKENCAYQSDHISLLCDFTVPSALNFCFLSILLQPKRKRSC